MMLNDFITRAKRELLSPDVENNDFHPAARPAAVLIPLILRDEPTVLLTQRTLNLPTHAGQIGFAGGKLEAGETPLQAALRESHEEIGLEQRFITAIGQMPPKLTRTGFEIVGVVALIDPAFTLTLNKGEVESVFEVPLAFLMDEKNLVFKSRLFMGRERFYYAISFQGYYIWGVTASLIQNLHERLYHP
jgi:8-oxo-dGTP pyrophosphatase MutT (NUDIX family)